MGSRMPPVAAAGLRLPCHPELSFRTANHHTVRYKSEPRETVFLEGKKWRNVDRFIWHNLIIFSLLVSPTGLHMSRKHGPRSFTSSVLSPWQRLRRPGDAPRLRMTKKQTAHCLPGPGKEAGEFRTAATRGLPRRPPCLPRTAPSPRRGRRLPPRPRVEGSLLEYRTLVFTSRLLVSSSFRPDSVLKNRKS